MYSTRRSVVRLEYVVFPPELRYQGLSSLSVNMLAVGRRRSCVYNAFLVDGGELSRWLR